MPVDPVQSSTLKVESSTTAACPYCGKSHATDYACKPYVDGLSSDHRLETITIMLRRRDTLKGTVKTVSIDLDPIELQGRQSPVGTTLERALQSLYLEMHHR